VSLDVTFEIIDYNNRWNIMSDVAWSLKLNAKSHLIFTGETSVLNYFE